MKLVLVNIQRLIKATDENNMSESRVKTILTMENIRKCNIHYYSNEIHYTFDEETFNHLSQH